jgi:hypothetical protein
MKTLDLNVTLLLPYIAIIVAFCFFLYIYWVFVAGRRFFLSATNGFALGQADIMLGTILSADLGKPLDLAWVMLLLGSWVCFTMGAIAANLRKQFKPRREIHNFVSSPLQFDLKSGVFSLTIVQLGLVCLAVGTAFSIAVGHNVFFLGLQQLIRGDDPIGIFQDYSTKRTEISYGGEHYFAPGYTGQFTAVLMPLLLYLLYFRIRKSHRFAEAAYAILLLVAGLYFLTIAGGRGPLVSAVMTFVILFTPFGPFPWLWRYARRSVWILLFLLLTFYLLSTSVMGRLGTDFGGLSLVRGGIEDAYNRTTGQSRAYLEIMRIVMSQPIVWGQQWLQNVVDLLPGLKGGGLGNEFHALLYSGNTRGYMGLPAWGWTYYNWGWFGTLVTAFFTGMLMQAFNIVYVRGKRQLSRVVVLFDAGLRLSGFVDLYSLFLGGFVTSLLYYALICVVKSRSSLLNLPIRTSRNEIGLSRLRRGV